MKSIVNYIGDGQQLRSAYLVQKIKKGILAGGAIVKHFDGEIKTIRPEMVCDIIKK